MASSRTGLTSSRASTTSCSGLATEAIARKLGDALVAPIVPFVPEGDIDPPTLHMNYPTTISITEGTYRALLAEICACLRTHGFRRIVLIGDSGGNQEGMEAVANDLNAKWSGGMTQDLLYQGVLRLSRRGEVAGGPGHQQTPEGLHDDFAITAQMAAVDPKSVRAEERIKAGKFRINGVDLAPVEKTAAWGRKIADYRAEATIAAAEAGDADVEVTRDGDGLGILRRARSFRPIVRLDNRGDLVDPDIVESPGFDSFGRREGPRCADRVDHHPPVLGIDHDALRPGIITAILSLCVGGAIRPAPVALGSEPARRPRRRRSAPRSGSSSRNGCARSSSSIASSATRRGPRSSRGACASTAAAAG